MQNKNFRQLSHAYCGALGCDLYFMDQNLVKGTCLQRVAL